MKWSKFSIIFVAAILAISYIYSSISENQLSNEVRKSALESCAKDARYDCDSVLEHHDDCFNSSYRAELKIRSFHYQEYWTCLVNKSNSTRTSK